MNPEQIYHRCCEATQALLRGFETRDLSLIERQVGLLRQHLSGRRAVEDSLSSGQTLLRMEQLDALDGITEQMERSLAAIRQSAQAEFERMLSTQGLFRHLTADSSQPQCSSLPVC